MAIKLSTIKQNPNNPRVIKDDKFQKLVNSIKEFPKMMELRPMVINENNIVLGGNMRLKALKELGYKEVPNEWIKNAKDLTADEQRRFIIADNVGFGEHDWEMLANEWNVEELSEWGLDVPAFETLQENISNEKDNEHLSQPEHLERWLNSSIKQMKLSFEEDVFEKVVIWFEKLQKKNNLETNSDVIIKIMENENI
jgi:hypothetical protein